MCHKIVNACGGEPAVQLFVAQPPERAVRRGFRRGGGFPEGAGPMTRHIHVRTYHPLDWMAPMVLDVGQGWGRIITASQRSSHGALR